MPDAPPPRAVAAARRLVGPARILGGVAAVLWRVAAVAGALFWVELFARPLADGDRRTLPRIVLALVVLLVLALPAWWLRHARETFADLVVLPDRLETLHRQGRPDLSIASRDDLRQLRRGGLVNAVRTIRKTVGEISDFVGPASSALEVAAPPFWTATVAATIASAVLVVLALTVGPLVLLLG